MEQRALSRPFKIIAFDWDGTAVMSRKEDAAPVRVLLEKLLELGVYIVVITGTNFQNVDRQLSSAINGPHKRRLYVCTNRGSEVYSFDAQSRPVFLWKRVAEPWEDRLLTGIADTIRNEIEKRTGLEIRVVYNRLNRRKIDLIPLPEWRDPPKSTIGQLLEAVEQRLKGAGVAGGLREVYAETERLAEKMGLHHASITSDVKHIEVGLTDKGDSIDWMMRELAAKTGVQAKDILIGGDEFGPIGGFEGSDYKMVTPLAEAAVFVSVGVEPNGVPPEVIHLGGGPPRFRQLLEEQISYQEASARGDLVAAVVRRSPEIAAKTRETNEPTVLSDPGEIQPMASSDPNWILVEVGFEPEREHEIESLFTVANGYLGTRGSLQEGSAMSLPATFIAGVFSDPNSVPELAIAPDWAQFRAFVEEEELQLDNERPIEHRRKLDMRRGVLEREWRHTDRAGRITSVQFSRFVSLADRHALVESLTLVPENYSGRVRVESTVDGRVSSEEGVTHLESLAIAPGPVSLQVEPGKTSELMVLTAQALGSDKTLAFATAGIFRPEQETDPAHSTLREEGWMGDRWEWEAEIGLSYRIDKLVSVYTSRDVPNPQQTAAEHLAHLLSKGVDTLLADHEQAWSERWKTADIEIKGDENAQRAARFAIYHLIATANPADEEVSIGARALTGEAYKGHVFWDTEIYMLPFYIHTHPATARALLMYRYHNLPAACEKARTMGYRGALYPWESTDTGEEATPPIAIAPDGEIIPILSGELEHHISADVAYAIWQYWTATGDDIFLLDAGAEILLQTARFWASRGRLEEDGKYHIRRVIGPDEYHESVDDNAYTNLMAQWNLERGVDAAQILQDRWPEPWKRLTEKLELGSGEVEEWAAIGRAMYTGFDPATGLFEQFRGYFDLEYVDLKEYEPRTAPMDVLLGRERIAQTQVIKQPDVLMLVYLLWDHFPPDVKEANFRYYEPRCGHGSSLSPSVHSLVAARLGDLALAERYFRQASEIDLANNMGNAAGGVHAAAQGGLWQALALGFGGMRPKDDGLAFDPHLLTRWETLSFAVRWQGRQVRVTGCAKPRSIDVVLEAGESMTVTLGGNGGFRTTISLTRPLSAKSLDGKWRRRKKVSR